MLREFQPPEPIDVSDGTPSEKPGKVEPAKNDSFASRIGAHDDNANKSASECHFSRKNCLTVVIVANLVQTTEMPYLLREVLDDHEQKLRILIQRNAFNICGSVVTVTLRTIVNGNDNEVEAVSVENGVFKRLKLAVKVFLVDVRHRLAAL